MTIQANVLVGPIVTEKTTQQSGRYTFQVHLEATKPAVKAAVKEFYGVDVIDVKMIAIKPKTRTVGRGRTMTKRSAGKKAVITLKDGQTLNYNDFK